MMPFHKSQTAGLSMAEKIEFMSIPEPMSGCTLWLGSIDGCGYGSVWDNGKCRGAHCVAWEAVNGPVPEGLEIDHKCRVRSCVNPAHLRLMTHRDNTLLSDNAAGRNSRKTRCLRGHEFDRVGPNGERICRRCRNDWARADYARRKGAA